MTEEEYNNSNIIIPILGDDTLIDLIRAFILELMDKEFLYVGNSTEGESLTYNIYWEFVKNHGTNCILLKENQEDEQ